MWYQVENGRVLKRSTSLPNPAPGQWVQTSGSFKAGDIYRGAGVFEVRRRLSAKQVRDCFPVTELVAMWRSPDDNIAAFVIKLMTTSAVFADDPELAGAVAFLKAAGFTGATTLEGLLQ